MSLVDSAYACGVLLAVAGSMAIGWLAGRSQLAAVRERLQRVAQLALDRGATPAQLAQLIGKRAAAQLCWPADTVVMQRVDDGPYRGSSPTPQPPRNRNNPAPRFVAGRQAVNGRQEAPAMDQTRVMDAETMRRHLNGGGRS